MIVIVAVLLLLILVVLVNIWHHVRPGGVW